MSYDVNTALLRTRVKLTKHKGRRAIALIKDDIQFWIFTTFFPNPGLEILEHGLLCIIGLVGDLGHYAL